jgi:hypothetical protein
MRPREMLANWLLCATFEAIEGRELMFYSDSIGGDGIIRDEATGETWPTEHVYVSQYSTGADAKALILDAIKHKQAGGAAYASGKILVCFSTPPRPVSGFQPRLRRRCRTRFSLPPYGSSALHASRRGLHLRPDSARPDTEERSSLSAANQ